MTDRSNPLPAPANEADTAPASDGGGALPTVSGAGPGEWNEALLRDVIQVAAWTDLRGENAADALPRVRAAVKAMAGIEPDDVIADMAAAQLVAAHSLAMDCYRRAAAGGELEVWLASVNQAGRLTRTWAALVEALNRHRGKTGQQTVRVEHVTVADGGQAIVGNVERGAGDGKAGRR